MGVIWKGSKALVLLPDSPEIKRADQDYAVFTYRGPYSAALRAMPAKGSAIVGYPGLSVSEVGLRREEPDIGMMTVRAVGLVGSISPGENDDPEPIRVRRAVQWTPYSRPLATAPGFYQLMQEWDAVDTWDREPRADLRQVYKYEHVAVTENGSVSARTVFELSAEGKKAAKKIQRGVTSWIDYHPVATMTSLYRAEPPVEPCGQIELPIGFMKLPDGYEFRRSGDSKTEREDGQWLRVTEWTGVKGEWDRDLYPVGG